MQTYQEDRVSKRSSRELRGAQGSSRERFRLDAKKLIKGRIKLNQKGKTQQRVKNSTKRAKKLINESKKPQQEGQETQKRDKKLKKRGKKRKNRSTD